MANQHSATQGPTPSLILVPSLITLAVTILRLVGELQNWLKLLFNRSAGGGGALVGISWLVPIFGIYFALKLAGSGARPASMGRAIGFTLLGLLVMVGGTVLMGLSLRRGYSVLVAGLVLLAVSAVIPLAGWPALTKTLIAYGYAARIPVAIVMFFAIRGNWGTHYDAPPPNLPAMAFWPKYVLIGLLPQLIFWIALTVTIGALFGIIAVAIFRRQGQAAQASS
jgi:hypothetical protein